MDNPFGGYCSHCGKFQPSITADDLRPDKEGYVSLRDVAHLHLNMQGQYASYYVLGLADHPRLDKGLRFKGDPHNYHALLIHNDDVQEFVRRVQEVRLGHSKT